jgi:hypothetical protein
MQILHQLLERHVGVRIGAQARLAHTCKQLAETRVTSEVGAEHQRVGKQADERFQLEVVAICQRRADDHVLLPRVSAQQRLEARQQDHEERRALLAAHLTQAVGERSGKHQIETRACPHQRGGAWVIALQPQRRRQAVRCSSQ